MSDPDESVTLKCSGHAYTLRWVMKHPSESDCAALLRRSRSVMLAGFSTELFTLASLIFPSTEP